MPIGLFIVAGVLTLLPLASLAVVGKLSRKQSRARGRQAAPPLAHELPWWQVLEGGTIIGTDLTYSVGFSLQGVDTDCLSEANLGELQRQLHGFLLPLPAGTRLQWIHATYHDHEQVLEGFTKSSSESECANVVARAKLRAIRDAPWLRRSSLYLFCSLANPRRGGLSKLTGPRLFEQVTAYAHDESTRRLNNLAHQVASALAALGVNARRLDGRGARKLMYELLNPGRSRTVPAPSAKSFEPLCNERTVREQLCFSNVRESADFLELDGRLVRVISLRDLPTATDPALLEALTVNLPFACRVQLDVEMLDDQSAIDGLKRKRDQANAHAALGKRRNQEAEAQAADVEDLIDNNLAASIRMVRVGIAVVLSVDATADGPDLLEHQTSEVLRTLAGLHGAQGMVETYAQLDSFLGSLPANAHHRSRSYLCTSENAAHMLLVWQSWPGHECPAVLLENGRNYLVGLDPFSPELDNPNAFMAGASGAGKSVTTNYLLMHLFGSGVRGLIIDVGGSYKKLLELYGGAYFTFDQDADAALNLFYEPSEVLLSDGTIDPLKRRFMLAVLESLLAEHDRPRLSHEQIAVLESAIGCLYQRAAQAPILSDLQALLRDATWTEPEDHDVARQLSRRLQRWTTGCHARLLNRRSTVRLTSNFAGFDLRGLADEVRAPVVLILSGIIWNLVTDDPTEKKVVVFDEVWTLLSNPVAAGLIEELYRTSRKYRCAILSISQSVDDFTGSPIAQALVNNSATTYLLRHRAGHDVIADSFHLNDRERYVFEGLEMRRGEFSELLVLAGRLNHFVGRIVLTPLEYWIATTHPADRELLGQVCAEHPELGLLDQLSLCAERAPRGASEVDRASRAGPAAMGES